MTLVLMDLVDFAPVAAAFMVRSFIVVVLNFTEDIRLDLALLDLRNDLMSMPFVNEDEGLWIGEGRGTGRTLGAAMGDTGSCMGNILGVIILYVSLCVCVSF